MPRSANQWGLFHIKPENALDISAISPKRISERSQTILKGFYSWADAIPPAVRTLVFIRPIEAKD